MPKFNKMFVMLPVMLMARKLDSEDPNVVNLLRISYAVVQTLCVILVAYTYYSATRYGTSNQIVYVPPPAVPFADPNTKKKYTEIAFGAQVVNTARSLAGSTLFGIALTVGLHYYKGMVMGLAIQTVMAPLNLLENALVKAIFLGNGIRAQDRIFEEKVASELTNDDQVVDEQGNPIVRSVTGGADKELSLEEVMLNTWDMGDKADIGKLMDMLTKKNCNFQTSDDKWTPLMILCGLGRAPGTASAMRTLLEMGANPAVVDNDGWTCLHWAAFHNSVTAANVLAKESANLLSKTDKEGNTPIDTARKENNEDVAVIYENALGESKKSK